jgi:hypothetical protein
MSSSNRFGLLSDEPYNVAPVVEKSSAKVADSFEQQKPSNAPNARGSDERNRHANKGKPQGRRNNLGAHGQNAEFQNAEKQENFRQNDRQPRGDRPRNRLPGQTRQRFQDRHGSENPQQDRPKRGGRGKFNTGAPTDGSAEQAEKPQTDAAEAPVEEVKEEVVEEAAAPAVEDDGTLTLEQYLAKQAELACADDLTLNVRIAGQDIDEENFESTKVLSREDEEDDSILGGGRGGHKVSNKHTGVNNSVSAPKATHMELLNPNANSIMFRGSRPSSSYQSRGPRNNKAPVNLSDASAFPALGKR